MTAQSYQLTTFESVLLIQLPEKVTVVEAHNFRENFKQWIEDADQIKTIILDFVNTQILDSSGIGALLGNYKSAQAKGIKLKLWGVTEPVKMALNLSGLDSLFDIEPHSESLERTVLSAKKSRPALAHPSVRSRTKRILDIVGAVVGLGITGVIFLPVAAAIKLSSPGPIFFSQDRCGLMGRRFKIWKFRSMVADAEALKHTVSNEAQGAFFKNAEDPRITPIGRFMRKTSLDELPQFWNVLKGDMSLIGTRPPTFDELEQYEVLNWQRLDVKPGMSGEWQVNGRSKVSNFEDVIKLDLQYQEKWSLMYDIKLLLKTVFIIFHKESGAA